MSSNLRKIVNQKLATQKKTVGSKPKPSPSRTGSGMTAYNLLARLKQAREAGVTELLDTGSGGVIRITKDLGLLVVKSAGTRTLQHPSSVAQGTKVLVDTTSGCTINSAVIAAGGFAEFVRTVDSAGVAQWSVSSSDSVMAHTHNAADITAGTLATARLGSGVADATTFLRGDQTWAVPAGGAASDGFTTIVSSADEDKTNLNVAQDHSEFQFPVTANKRYMVEMLFWGGGNDTSGYAFRFAVASGIIKGRGTHQHLNVAGAVANTAITTGGTGATNTLSCQSVADLEFGIADRLIYVFVPDTTTTFKFQFGNNTPGAGVTSRTGKGSIMRWKQMN